MPASVREAGLGWAVAFAAQDRAPWTSMLPLESYLIASSKLGTRSPRILK